MADKRINALTTTSASVGDDYFAIDGATNGTRALSAFSPTFGGNATVGGTLTVSGGIVSLASSSTALTSVSSSTSGATGYNQASFTLDSGGTPKTAVLGVQDTGAFFGSNTNHNVTIRTNLTDRITVSNAGVVSISSTTASTTTSSGALVVGNGTSGGLGVGGAINAGGDIATAATMRSVGFHVPGNGAGRPASTDSYLASTATTQIPLYVSGYTGGGQSADILRVSFNSSSDWFSVKGNGQVSCFATTASTSTSSGALVVSGGVGVGGALYTGGGVVISGSTGVSVIGGRQWSFKANSSGGSPASGCVIRDDSAAADRLTIDINGNTSVLSTTPSTSTSSGALVVSGGVGVAGAINAGDQIKSERTSGTDTASAVLGVLTTTGAGVTNSFGIDARVIVNNSSGTTTSATGLRALSRVSNVSTVTQAVAMLAQVDNPGGGTITTAYGLYVNPITAGGTNYAIYTGGGRINFQSLPTSSAGLAAGTIWNDGGTLKVA